MAISREPPALPTEQSEIAVRSIQAFINSLGNKTKPKAILMVVSDDELLVKDCLQTFGRHTGGQMPMYYVCETACRLPPTPVVTGFVRTEEDFSVDFLYDTLRDLEAELEFPGIFDNDICDECQAAADAKDEQCGEKSEPKSGSPDGEGGLQA